MLLISLAQCPTLIYVVWTFSWPKVRVESSLMWVNQCHKSSPSHQHFYRWYVHYSKSWLVYGIVLPTFHTALGAELALPQALTFLGSKEQLCNDQTLENAAGAPALGRAWTWKFPMAGWNPLNDQQLAVKSFICTYTLVYLNIFDPCGTFEVVLICLHFMKKREALSSG